MIIVGYLYNNNGMATWCMEAALALHKTGRQVLLVKSPSIQLPKTYPVKVIDFETNAQYAKHGLMSKIRNRIKRYWQILPNVKIEDGLLPALQQYLQEQSIVPACYLLNQASYVNRKVAVKQLVVSWSYRPFLKDYLQKAILLAEGAKGLSSNLYNAIYWHKVDWYAYRNASAVMAVSEKLTDLLKTSGVNAFTIYPGTNNGDSLSISNLKLKVVFAAMALSLDDKRKGLAAIIECLKQIKPYNFELVLIGGCNEKFKEWVLEEGFPARFTGLLARDKALEVLNGSDVLLFGSLVDDWGFVQVEAMANGMAILSPNQSPFDEIVGREDYLYTLGDKEDLEKKLGLILKNNNVQDDRNWFKERYATLFSVDAFGKALINAINSC